MASSATAPPWARRRNRFKEALASAPPPIAMWVTQEFVGVIDVIGAAGVDAAIIDLEHTPYGLEMGERLIIACEAAGISPLVRATTIDPKQVARILDAGAHGVIFPMVEDAEQAALAVSCLHYAPRGVRGWGGVHTRHAVYHGGYVSDHLFGRLDFPGIYSRDYVDKAEDVLAMLIVETVRGVENIEEIAAVPGIDAIEFGLGDYSVQVGFDANRCREAARAVYAACRKNGVGMPLAPPKNVPVGSGVGLAIAPGDEFYPGCFLIAGVDTIIMSNALRAAVERTQADREVLVQDHRIAKEAALTAPVTSVSR